MNTTITVNEQKDLVAIGKKLIAHAIKEDVTASQREPDNNYANA